jgi:hypothetical protein
MNRRRFLETTACAAMWGSGPALFSAQGEGRKPPFRVLYSNDTTNVTGCISPWHRKGAPFEAGLIEASVDEVAGLVDAHFLQPGLGEVPMWPSRVEPVEEHYRWIKETYGEEPDAFGHYVLGGGDVVKVFLDRCRLRGQAAFISLRLNDAHHKEWVNAKPGEKGGNVAMSVTKFYRDHPEYRIGPKLGSAQFQVLNWAHPEVPARKLALLTELCENYDLDGVELDFMRFYSFFPRDTTTGEQRRGIITAFVRAVRARLDRTARDGRRRWLCARVPGFLSAHDPLGLDLPALTAAGLDMVNLSASYFTTQQMDVAAIRALVPQTALYVELCHSTWNGPKLAKGYDVFPFRRTTREQLATTAHLARARGADGMSLFNFAYYREHGGPGRGPFHEPPFDVLPHLAERVWLANQPQHWFLAPGWENPFAKPAVLPRRLESGAATEFNMELAPPAGGWKTEARLRVQTLDPMPGRRLTTKLNGTALTATPDLGEPFPNPDPPLLGTPETLTAWSVPSALLRDGANRVEVTLESGEAVNLAFLDLAMR